MALSADSIRPESVEPFPLVVIADRLGVSAEIPVGTMITGVASSSVDVQVGDIFVAVPGDRNHGATFVTQACERGASAIITDEAGAQMISGCNVPILVVPDPRAVLGHVSSWVYRTDVHTPRMFGITGTNGKTTAAYMLMAVLNKLGAVTGLSSTSERIVAGKVYSSGLTTPESDQMHALIAAMTERGVSDAVLEVSAHALSRHRVDALFFDVVGFTNFSQDHLDDYGSMASYFAAKMALFTPERATQGVVVVDPRWIDDVMEMSAIPLVTLGLGAEHPADWRVDIEQRSPVATSFRLTGPAGQSLTSRVPLVGDYSAVNAGLAIVMCVVAGVPFEDLRAALERADGIDVFVPGRTELVSGPTGPRLYVDYGHTPDAFAATLKALREITPGKLIMVFGADGDRDTSKRAAMGANAALGADVVVVTDFHPRREDPALIRAQLLAGARGAGAQSEIHEIASPPAAVRFALSLATTGDTILYAGPGHENYREVAGAKIPYDAREDCRSALVEAGWSTS